MTGIIGNGFIWGILSTGIILFLGPIIIPLFFYTKKLFRSKKQSIQILFYLSLFIASPLAYATFILLGIYVSEYLIIQIPKSLFLIYRITLSIGIIALIPFIIREIITKNQKSDF